MYAQNKVGYCASTLNKLEFGFCGHFCYVDTENIVGNSRVTDCVLMFSSVLSGETVGSVVRASRSDRRERLGEPLYKWPFSTRLWRAMPFLVHVEQSRSSSLLRDYCPLFLPFRAQRLQPCMLVCVCV